MKNNFFLTSAPREHRIDFLRGLALILIFINHTPGNIFSFFTPSNFGFSDSAEIFVLLAGFAAAQAYYPVYLKGLIKHAISKAYTRAITLYLWHIASIFTAFGILALSAHFFNPGYLHDTVAPLYVNVSPLLKDFSTSFWGLITLGHQLGYFNILPMYIVLLLGMPLVMGLARLSVFALLACSLSLWFLCGFFWLNIPNSLTPGGWFFNPFAWQVLFSIGFSLGIFWRSGHSLPTWFHRVSPILVVFSIGYLIFAYFIIIRHAWYDVLAWFPKIVPLFSFDKTYVALPRLLHVLCLITLVTCTPIWRWLEQFNKHNLLVILGRNALPIFSLGSLLVLLASILRIEAGGGIWVDSLVVGSELILIFLLGLFLEGRKKSLALVNPTQQSMSQGRMTA